MDMWLYFFLSYVLTMIGSICSKEYADKNKLWYIILACVSFGLSNIPWAYALRKGVSLSSLTPIMSISLMISIVTIGFWYYQEPISWNKILGICVGLLGIILILK